MISDPGTNTPITCISHCASLGYSAGGVEVRFCIIPSGHRLNLFTLQPYIVNSGGRNAVRDILDSSVTNSKSIQGVVPLPMLRVAMSQIRNATWLVMEIPPIHAEVFRS